MENWDTNADGKLKLVPVLAFQTAASPAMALLRLAFARSVEDFQQDKIEYMQLSFVEEQARMIGEELLYIADQLRDGQAAAPN